MQPTTSSSNEMLSLNDISLFYQTAAWAYLPCNSMSQMHDLLCGHCVSSSVNGQCGSNCTHPFELAFALFIRLTCITQSVLADLDLSSDTDVEEIWAQGTIEANMVSGIVSSLVEDAMLGELDKQHRDATPVPKTDGITQFVADHGRGVLKHVERDLMTVTEAVWGLEISTTEDKMDIVEKVITGLSLGDNDDGE
jgi:hypothetical protein